jgi:acyl-ACP thioesterase
MNYESLAERGLFWAVTRHRVQITRLPMRGETLRIETWPMPTTRVAYPRATVAYDQDGQELFRCISLWVLMDRESRAMVLPGKSGVTVEGIELGTELSAPRNIVPKELTQQTSRTVVFSDLDRNGHMNNTRYLDWVSDLLPSGFHGAHTPTEFTVCYTTEGREGQSLQLRHELVENTLQVDASRDGERVFAARILYT